MQKSKKKVAKRMRKYRAEKSLMANLSNAKQQLGRSKMMASGTPDRLKREAAERKRRHRMRAKEQEKGRQSDD